MPLAPVNFYIHPTNIWVETGNIRGFSIDKKLAKALLEQIAESDGITEKIQKTFLSILESAQTPGPLTGPNDIAANLRKHKEVN